jgi:hypothetical protein
MSEANERTSLTRWYKAPELPKYLRWGDSQIAL